MRSSPRRSDAREGGFTLLEVAIATVILAGMILVVFLLLSAGTTLTANQSIQTRIAGETSRFLDQFASDFRGSGSTVSPTNQLLSGDPFYDGSNVSRYTSIRFSLPTVFDLNSNTSLYEQHITYFWAISPLEIAGNNKDDDRNGLVDDGVIKRAETDKNGNTTTSVVLHNVTENGLAFQYIIGDTTKDDVTVFVEVTGIDPKFVRPDMNPNDPTDKSRMFIHRVMTGISRRGN